MIIGLVVSNYGEEVKQLVETVRSKNHQPVLITTELLKISDLSIPMLLVRDLWKFREPVIATCETTTRFVEKCPIPIKKWTTFTGKNDLESFEESNLD